MPTLARATLARASAAAACHLRSPDFLAVSGDAAWHALAQPATVDTSDEDGNGWDDDAAVDQHLHEAELLQRLRRLGLEAPLVDTSPARQPATDEELSLVPQQLRDVVSQAPDQEPWRMRTMQARALGSRAIGSGRDVVVVAATGCGKSFIIYANAAADAVAAHAADPREGLRQLRPIDVVVVPTVAIGYVHERDGCSTLEAACRGRVPDDWVPRAQFVRHDPRRQRPAVGVGACPSRLCCKEALPHTGPLGDLSRATLGWCVACYKQRKKLNRTHIAACELLKGPAAVGLHARSTFASPACAERTRLSSSSSSSSFIHDASRRRVASVGGAEEAGGEGEGAVAQDGPCTLSDLPDFCAERAIAEDSTLLLAVVTASALRKDSDRSVLLRQALAQRGVRRVFIDEAHCGGRISMGSFSEDVAHVGQSIAVLRTAQRSFRPTVCTQTVALSATWPPSCDAELTEANGIAHNAVHVQCSVDRPELRFVRVPFPQRPDESFPMWCMRGMRWLLDNAPVRFVRGRVVIFVTFRRDALALANALKLPRSGGRPGKRRCCWYVSAREAQDAAAQVEQMRLFESEDDAVLIGTEALTHGTGTSHITLVAQFGIANGPLEFWQRAGRAARLHGEYGLVAQFESSRFLIQQLLLTDAQETEPMLGPRLIERFLRRRVCVRRPILLYLGEATRTAACAQCDECERFGRGGLRDAAHLGALPYLFEWICARKAACVLLQSLPADSTAFLPSLSQLVGAPPVGAPPPFDDQGKHDLLVRALYIEGSIKLRLAPAVGSKGSVGYCYRDADSTHAYLYENRGLSVLIPSGYDEDDDDSAAHSDGNGNGDAARAHLHAPPARTASTDSAQAQAMRVRAILDRALAMAAEGGALLSEDLAIAAACPLSAADLHLLAAARGEAYNTPGPSSSHGKRTQTQTPPRASAGAAVAQVCTPGGTARVRDHSMGQLPAGDGNSATPAAPIKRRGVAMAHTF